MTDPDDALEGQRRMWTVGDYPNEATDGACRPTAPYLLVLGQRPPGPRDRQSVASTSPPATRGPSSDSGLTGTGSGDS